LLAGVVFVVLGALGVGAYLFLSSEGVEDDEVERASAEPSTATPSPSTTTAPNPAAEVVEPAPSTTRVVWTTPSSTSLSELSRVWSIPKDTLRSLNPSRALSETLAAGTSVVVHDETLGTSISIGPPNDGRLVRGVPLPEGAGWLLPEDRARAFGTAETVASITAALHRYRKRFPDAAPVQVGDLSARRGGRIYGHQSHQTGLDVDLRLVRDSSGEGFDAERTWFLVKTIVEGSGGSEVRAIFLNRTEQTWLREAAEADVGVAEAARVFELIRHEPGHTIHMHVRFRCAKEHKRCVGYSLPDTDEQDSKRTSKLPAGRAKPRRGKDKRPRLVPKKR
jgi:murein endopeptidase